MGPGRDPSCPLGPLVNKALYERSQTHNQDAISQGATLAVGGKRLTGQTYDGGYFLSPAVLANTDQTMLLMTEETFGPVLGVMSANSPREPICYANDSRYGLASYIFTKDLSDAMEAARRLEVGNVWINDIHHTYDEVPFGGFKESGLGREKSHYGLDEYLELKGIYLSL